MKPKAIRNLAMVRDTNGLLRLEMADAGREVVLDPLAELVWDLSDGSRSLEDLAQAAGRSVDRVVQKEEVFSALDFLADAGLIEARVAPPTAEGKVSRRSLLVQIAPVLGAGACMMLGASARAGGFFQKDHYQQNEYSGKVRQNMERDDKEVATKLSISKRKGNESSDGSSDREQDDKYSWRIWYDKLKGKIDNTGKYAVSSSHPLIGRWKTVMVNGVAISREIATGNAVTISSKGILEFQLWPSNWVWQENWKYTSTGPGTGFLQEFLGELIGRNDIRWINRNEYESTVALSALPNVKIGLQSRWVRDPYWREIIR